MAGCRYFCCVLLVAAAVVVVVSISMSNVRCCAIGNTSACFEAQFDMCEYGHFLACDKLVVLMHEAHKLAR